MKWQSFSDQTYLIISQSWHGIYQNKRAMDFAHLKGNAPAPKQKINYTRPQSDTKQNYFGFGWAEWQAQFVHTNPIKAVGSILTLGQALWKTTWHHVHVTIEVNGVWRDVLSVIDRTKVTLYWLKYGGKHPVWTNWDTYDNIELEPLPVTKTEMINLQEAITCQVIATVGLNIRIDPNTKAKIIGQLNPGTVFETKRVGQGDAVDGNATWYSTQGGWVSGKWIKEIPKTANEELQKQLNEANAKITNLNNIVLDYDTKIKKYKPAYDGALLIKSVE